MIEVKNNIFHILTGELSYIFRVTKYGHLEHVYFGNRINTEDIDAICVKPGLGWGCSVLINDKDTESCLNDRPLEWSTYGLGDLRESPIELDNGSYPMIVNFVYKNYVILSQDSIVYSNMPQAHGSEDTLIITLEDRATGLLLQLYYSSFNGVITRRCVLENPTVEKIYINKLMSFSIDILGNYKLLDLHGGWIAETHASKSEIGNRKSVNESNTGFSSNNTNPAFAVYEYNCNEDYGEVYGFNLIYSGNHYSSVCKSKQGLIRIQQGISPTNFRWKLRKGESFETPEAVITYSDKGFNGMSGMLHRFVNENIIPDYWKYRDRPVIFNNWEGCMFDFDQNKLLRLADKAKKVGCELFVLDDGWFGHRNNDHSGLGDYNVNKKKIPEGLGNLSQDINKKGMKFGIWIEPESVNKDSDLYRCHPDWAIDGLADNALLGRHQLLLDLRKAEVREYIVNSISKLLDSAHIEYIKWDINRNSVLQGAEAHKYILGLYEVYRRIFENRKNILLENCASGGNRFDLGMLCFSPQIWVSDDTDPVERLDIQRGLSYFYPQSCFGNHVSATPHAQTLRDTPLETRANVAFFGCLGYELDLDLMTISEIRAIKEQVSFYKKYRKMFQYGSFIRNEYELEKEIWQINSENITAVSEIRRLIHAAHGYDKIKVKNLNKDAVYIIQSRKTNIRLSKFGNLLNYVLPANLNSNSIIFRQIDKIYSLKDYEEKYIASGNTLKSGFVPHLLFTGTGYDGNQHILGDFGSELYIISKNN